MQTDTTDHTRIIYTPIGAMIAIADEHGITYLDFTDAPSVQNNSDHHLLVLLEEELHEYFDGKRSRFTLPLYPQGTPFQKSVWETLRTIPYGETISYGTEAKMFGNPKAVRAVAGANARNPISILLPCHRVIASDGRIGGYSGGIWRKEFLLALEKSLNSGHKLFL